MLDVIPVVVYHLKGLCTSLLLLTEILLKSYVQFLPSLKFRKIENATPNLSFAATCPLARQALRLKATQKK